MWDFSSKMGKVPGNLKQISHPNVNISTADQILVKVEYNE